MKPPEQLNGRDDIGFRSAEVVFSLEDGFVWAGWPGKTAMIRLGTHDHVIAMMRDFLSQSELGERLMNGKSAAR